MSEDLFANEQAPEEGELGENGAVVVPPGANVNELTDAAGITDDGKARRSRPSRGSKGPKRNFPRRTLEDALKIPEAIHQHHGGNPWATAEVAVAIGSTPKSGTFFYWAAAARDYGLTEGGRDSAFITMLELGRRAVAPTSSEERSQALVDAFFNVPVFRQVVEFYKGSKLPPEEFLTNTLEQNFGVARDFIPEFIQIFEANARFVGVGNTWNGKPETSTTLSDVEQPRPSTPTSAVPPSSREKPKCFIAMPFRVREGSELPSGFFNEVMTQLLYPAIEQAGFAPYTAMTTGSDLIHATIVNELLDAEMVVVDLTDHNPNVLFELGLRMMDKKPVAIVRATGTGPIFDVTNMIRILDYDVNLWTSTVKSDIPKLAAHIKASWEGRDKTVYIDILRNR